MTDGEIDRMLEQVRAIGDPVDRWDELDRLKKVSAQLRRALARMRYETVNEMRAFRDAEHPEGWSLSQIADRHGETRSSIQYVAEGRGLSRSAGDDAASG